MLIIVEKQPKEEPKKDSSKFGQATKSVRGMPWHQEPTKDAAICEKPRGAESRL